jgi:DNA-binding winged helix-turn-helix (wHTH) protein/tetratricopeptide (TPR) repeat protein
VFRVPEYRRMTPARFKFGAFVLDPAVRELTRDRASIALPVRAFHCLLYLIEHRDRAVGRDELALAVFGRSNVSDAQIGQIVLRARRAVSDDGHAQNAIRTVPRFGFRWVAETQVDSGEAAGLSQAAVVPEQADPQSIQTHAAIEGSAPEAVGALAPPVANAARSHGRRAWWATAGLALVLTAAVGVAWWWRGAKVQDVQAGAPPVTLVLPTEVRGARDAAWIRLGLMDFIADRMRRAGLAVPPSENTLVMIGDGSGGAGAVASGRRTVRSTAEHRNGVWRVSLQGSNDDGTRNSAVGEDADLLTAARHASDRLLSALGRPAQAGQQDLGLQERLQRARAAMLSNELETARRILAAAPELQRNTPELLYQLARIEFREGRFEQGLAGLNRALATPAGHEPLFRARLLNARGAMHVRLEKSTDAERDFAAAIAVVDPARHHAELAQALTGRGVARAMQSRFDAALADLGQARVQALRAGDPLAASRIDANLGQLEMDRDRPAQALQYLAQAARDFERYGAVNELVTARSALVGVNLRLLRPQAAWEQSERAWALRERIRDPAQLGTLTLDRAEVLLRLGKLRAARALLDAPSARNVPPGDVQRRAFLLMEAAWRAGETRTALHMVNGILQTSAPGAGPRLQAWLRLRQRQIGLHADAPPLPWPPDLRAPAWMATLARAVAERQAGREATADAAYQEALRVVESAGVPEDVLETVADYAPWLIERGRLAEASALVGRVAPWAEQDFDAAVLQWQLYQALDQDALAGRALVHARALASERPLPTGMTEPPPGL